MRNVKEILEVINQLPLKDKRFIADSLTHLLEGMDPSVESAWKEEIERRVDEIESGKADLIPGEDVVKEIRELMK